MDENWLEIKDYNGAGYQPQIDFDCWRVAILRWEADSLPEKMKFMERHTQTDEVFVLLRGQAILIIGGNTSGVGVLQSNVLELGKIYNVKQGVWHTVLLSRDASILIVENRATGKENTEYYPISDHHRREIVDLSKVEKFY